MSTATATAPTPTIAPAAVDALAQTLNHLRSATRLRVLLLIADEPRNLTELCKLLGGALPSNVSHHLTLLRVSGITEAERTGGWNYHSLTAKGRALHGALLGLVASEDAAATETGRARR